MQITFIYIILSLVFVLSVFTFVSGKREIKRVNSVFLSIAATLILIDQFEEDVFKKTLESKMSKIKSFLHSNAISAIENYPEINFEHDDKELNFVVFFLIYFLRIYQDAYCQTTHQQQNSYS